MLTACADQLIYNSGLIKLCSACAKQNAAGNASDTALCNSGTKTQGPSLKFKSGTQDPPQSLQIFSAKYMFEMVPTKEYRKNFYFFTLNSDLPLPGSVI